MNHRRTKTQSYFVVSLWKYAFFGILSHFVTIFFVSFKDMLLFFLSLAISFSGLVSQVLNVASLSLNSLIPTDRSLQWVSLKPPTTDPPNHQPLLLTYLKMEEDQILNMFCFL